MRRCIVAALTVNDKARELQGTKYLDLNQVSVFL